MVVVVVGGCDAAGFTAGPAEAGDCAEAGLAWAAERSWAA
jgi:hypothetical protein